MCNPCTQVYVQPFNLIISHHPIPNDKLPPMTSLLNKSTYHKITKGSPPPCPQMSWAPQINEKTDSKLAGNKRLIGSITDFVINTHPCNTQDLHHCYPHNHRLHHTPNVLVNTHCYCKETHSQCN